MYSKFMRVPSFKRIRPPLFYVFGPSNLVPNTSTLEYDHKSKDIIIAFLFLSKEMKKQFNFLLYLKNEYGGFVTQHKQIKQLIFKVGIKKTKYSCQAL